MCSKIIKRISTFQLFIFFIFHFVTLEQIHTYTTNKQPITRINSSTSYRNRYFNCL